MLFLVLIAAPLVLAVFFGLFAFRGLPPLVFRCRRCDGWFRRPAHRPFPAVCPRCGARDWNLPGRA